MHSRGSALKKCQLLTQGGNQMMAGLACHAKSLFNALARESFSKI